MKPQALQQNGRTNQHAICVAQQVKIQSNSHILKWTDSMAVDFSWMRKR